MIENKDADLSLLAPYFIEGVDYKQNEILSELQYYQKSGDFLCLLLDDGFLIGYPNRRSLWIAQLVNHGGHRDYLGALVYAKQWGKEHGLTSISGETDREEFGAMKRLGWEKVATIVGMWI